MGGALQAPPRAYCVPDLSRIWRTPARTSDSPLAPPARFRLSARTHALASTHTRARAHTHANHHATARANASAPSPFFAASLHPPVPKQWTHTPVLSFVDGQPMLMVNHAGLPCGRGVGGSVGGCGVTQIGGLTDVDLRYCEFKVRGD